MRHLWYILTIVLLVALSHLTIYAQDKEEVTCGMVEMPNQQETSEQILQIIKENLVYPDSAKAEKVEGVVYVGFMVTTSGEIHDVEIKRGLRSDLDNEALRITNLLKDVDWKPAKNIDGVEVDFSLTIPIRFELIEK